MRLEEFLDGARRLRGPLAMVFFDDLSAFDSTVLRMLRLGFERVLAFLPEGAEPRVYLPQRVSLLRLATRAPGAVTAAVNRVIDAAPGEWLHYAFGAEYLFYPFCESRSVAELLAFHAEERREAMPTWVVDLYPIGMKAAEGMTDPAAAHFDRIGYFSHARRDAAGVVHDRQIELHGGLRWRLEEHFPPSGRRLDRIGLFRARPGLRLGEDHLLNDPELNTYACPWHHNLTAAVASFRAAQALMANPASHAAAARFHWHGSERFTWHSQQLMDLGFMEPGQWF